MSPTCEIVGTGVGGKKQEAKEKAAEEAMEKLGWVSRIACKADCADKRGEQSQAD